MESYTKIFIIGLKHLKKLLTDDTNGNKKILLFCFFFTYLVCTIELIHENDLDQRTAYAPGVITKIEGGKNAHKLYKFYVGNDVYYGQTGYGGLTKIRVSDSVIVAYEYTNPGNNERVCYFEYTLDRSKLPDTVFHRQPIDNQRRPLK